MACLNTIIANDLTTKHHPAPTARSLVASREAGLTSILAAPYMPAGCCSA